MKPSSNLRLVAAAASLAVFLGATPMAAQAALQEWRVDPTPLPPGVCGQASPLCNRMGAVAAVSRAQDSTGIAMLGLWALSTGAFAPELPRTPHPLDRLPFWEPASRGPRSLYEATATFENGEVFAIQRHLGAILERLGTRDVSTLSPMLRERRQQQIQRLSAYRERGVFPRNCYVPGLAPVFLDEEGRPCAVAYLMIESGSLELAERVAKTENLAYVPEITVSGVDQWIGESGLDVYPFTGRYRFEV